MKVKVLCVILIVIIGCNNKKKKDDAVILSDDIGESKSVKLDSIDLQIYDFAEFQKLLNKKDNKVYVINFWATWCLPCVKELPDFEKLNKVYKNNNVEVILVSLDFPHLYQSKLKPYIKKKNLKAKVIALDDPDMNSWIPKVSKSWSGSIPATIIYKNDTRKFFEKSFSYNELEKEVKQFLN